jgi:cysteine-rich repeat protein
MTQLANQSKTWPKGKILLMAFIASSLLSTFLLASAALGQTAKSSDAIAIRVLPNPKHLGPAKWYIEQKFKGSPQEMVVDGYEAIRDGNIVYVDAANIADGNFYTNIYAISFNLGSEQATSDIFGQILQYWKFNTNIASDGTCDGLPVISNDCSGTVGCWLFEGNANDGSQNAYNGTAVGTVNYADGHSSGQSLVLPNSNNNTTPSYINVGDKPNLVLSNEFTISVDIYPTGPGGNGTDGGIIINKEMEYEIARKPDGTIEYAISNSGLNNNPIWQWITASYQAPLNTWTNLVWVYGKNSVRIYANGVLVHNKYFTGSNTITNFGTSYKKFYIGYREGGGQAFQGKIDNVKIYNKILNESCSSNSDCSTGSYCQSNKTSLIRDTKRLADLAELNSILASYRLTNAKKCPVVSQGSYVPNHSISTWPSWQGTLGKNLNQLLPVDPINSLGICKPEDDDDNPNYDPTTCWDSRRKIFSKPTVPAPPYTMELPQNSWAYTYVSDKDGRKCAVNTKLESNYTNLANAGCVDGGSQSCPNNPVTASGNTPDPSDVLSVDCSNITAYPGSPVSAFLKIRPKSNTSINNVTLSGMASTWNTAVPTVNQYQSGYYWQIKSPAGGTTPNAPGNYAFKLNVTDSTGVSVQKDCSIKVLNSYIVISPVSNPAPVMQGHSLNQIKVKAAVKNLNLAPISFMFTVKDPATGEVLNDNHIPNQGFYSGAGIATGWVQGSNLGSTDQREYYRDFSGGEVIANAGPNGGTGKDYLVEVQAKDGANNTAFTSFIVHVYNVPPTGSPNNITLTASTGKQISEKIIDANDDQTNFDLSKANLGGQTFSNGTTLPSGVTDGTSLNHVVGSSKIYSYFFTGQLANSNVFDAISQSYNLILRIKDRFDVWRDFNFTVNVTNSKPVIDYTDCKDAVVRFSDASVPCKPKITDADGNKIRDVIVNDNAGLPLSSKIGINLANGGSTDFSFSPGNNRNFSTPPDHPVKFSAIDEFGLVGDQTTWNVRINNYCGDNIKDTPNTEGGGGPSNDGQEECDAPAGNQAATAFNGLAANPSASNSSKQYECTGQCTDRTNCANTCKYTGGYCGNNHREDIHGEGCDGTDNISTGATMRSGSSNIKQYQCAAGTCVPTGGWCGDNIIQNGSGNFNAGENCDKGNWSKSAAASDASNQYLCDGDCKQHGGYCGDGVVQNGTSGTVNKEECDDGNKNNNDGCNANCQKECSSFSFSSDLHNPSIVESADNIIYDSTYTATPPASDVAPYSSIKINDGPMPTPYIWIADTNNTGIVYKYRTYNGPKKLADGWDFNVNETAGQLVGQTPAYAGQPSRTAVNVETGDIWVAYRTGDVIRKFNIDGVFQCQTPAISGARGVAIRADGNVWGGGTGSANMYVINKDNCSFINTVNTSVLTAPDGTNCNTGSYGMAMGADGTSVWISGNGWGKVVNINDTSCLRVIPTGVYGITVDLNNNPQWTDVSGITIDSTGDFWQARYTSPYFYHHTSADNGTSNNLTNNETYNLGYGTHGTAGDSKGKVWFVQMDGAYFASFNPLTNVITQYSTPAGTRAYTYSDMTGINRAMLLRSATWISKEQTVSGAQFFFGKISYTQNQPAQSQVDTYLRVKNGGSWGSWISAGSWNTSSIAQRSGSAMQVKVMLKSQNQSKTPSLGDIKFTCP